MSQRQARGRTKTTANQVRFVNGPVDHEEQRSHLVSILNCRHPSSILLGMGLGTVLWTDDIAAQTYRILGCSTMTSQLEVWKNQSLSNEQISEHLALVSTNHGGSGDGAGLHAADAADDLSSLTPPYILDHLQSDKHGISNRIRLSKVASGSNHSLFLTDDGLVYGMGQNTNGQLVSYDNNFQLHRNGVPYPTLMLWFVERRIRIRDIACGEWFSAFITTNGDLYTAGRLGIENVVMGPVLRHGPSLSSLADDGGENGRRTDRVTKFGTGTDHLIFQCESSGSDGVDYRSESGQLYGIGNNSYGQLGTGTNDYCKKSTPCYFSNGFSGATPNNNSTNNSSSVTNDSVPPQLFTQCELVKIDGGERFTAILTLDHRVYVTGMPDDSNSNGWYTISTHFRRVSFDFVAPSVQITDLACSGHNTLLVDSMKRIFYLRERVNRKQQYIDASPLRRPILSGSVKGFFVVDAATGRSFTYQSRGQHRIEIEEQEASDECKRVLDHPDYEAISCCAGYFTNMTLLRLRKSTKCLTFFFASLRELLSEAGATERGRFLSPDVEIICSGK